MRGRPGHRPAPRGDSPGPRGHPRAAVFQRPPHGCVFSPLFCVSLCGARGGQAGDGEVASVLTFLFLSQQGG